MSPAEPNFSEGIVVFALLLDKSAIGVYTSYEKAEEAWDEFVKEERPANKLFQIKPFRLDGPAMIYQPY
jgi:hypothetical protein